MMKIGILVLHFPILTSYWPKEMAKKWSPDYPGGSME